MSAAEVILGKSRRQIRYSPVLRRAASARQRLREEAQRPYTARLQKGGALVGDMRQILLAWDGTPGCAERIVRTNAVSAPSRSRALDIVMRTFIPRFVASAPPDLWRGMQVVERAGWSPVALLPLHYYAAAAAEPLLWDFVVETLSARHAQGYAEVRVSEVLRFLDRSADTRFPGRRWSKEVSVRVARGLLAALRDFGVLSGAVKKRIAPMLLPPESFAFIARIRHDLGVRGQAALEDPCWRLFFLGETAVERLFLEAHQRKLLSYLAAGSVIRIDFPGDDLEAYARELAQRAN